MRRKKREPKELDNWQLNNDLMPALALVLLLIAMLLALCLLEIPQRDRQELHAGVTEAAEREAVNDHGPETLPTEDGGRHAEDRGAAVATDPRMPQEDSLPERKEVDGGKAAVMAKVVDAETGRAIEKEGIAFELYEKKSKNDSGVRRFLYTYYPAKIEYQNFETTEEGTFFLPEKMEQGYYSFKQITELDGYDPIGLVDFSLNDSYEWSDPYVVSIEASPAKNRILIRMEDGETHKPLSGGTFQILAVEDIITADGSVRCARDAVADTVTLGRAGNGKSKNLYEGTYTVVQGKIPRYYAGIVDSETVQVEKQDGSAPQTLEYLCEKTKIRVKLTDSLYTGKSLEGAEFRLRCVTDPELSKIGVTDENGEIVFTDLEKNASYNLKQRSGPEDYQYSTDGLKIYVDEYGRIEGAPEKICELTNYIPRVRVHVKDQLFGKPLSGLTVALYDGSGEKVDTWTSGGTEKILENLPEGDYHVQIDGEKNKKFEFEASDEVELCDVTVRVITVQSIVFIAAAGLILIITIVGILKVLFRRRRTMYD